MKTKPYGQTTHYNFHYTILMKKISVYSTNLTQRYQGTVTKSIRLIQTVNYAERVVILQVSLHSHYIQFRSYAVEQFFDKNRA